jgi:hypothetical protein
MQEGPDHHRYPPGLSPPPGWSIAVLTESVADTCQQAAVHPLKRVGGWNTVILETRQTNSAKEHFHRISK